MVQGGTLVIADMSYISVFIVVNSKLWILPTNNIVPHYGIPLYPKYLCFHSTEQLNITLNNQLTSLITKHAYQTQFITINVFLWSL